MQLVFNILPTFVMYLLVSTGFMVIFKAVKFFHISHAIAITACPYILFYFNTTMNLPVYFAIITSILFTIFLVVLLEIFLFKRLRKFQVPSWQLLIASLGAYIIFQNLVSIIWGDNSITIIQRPIDSGNYILGAYITDIQVITILGGILIFLTGLFILKKTQIGLKLNAISDNTQLSQIFGISPHFNIVIAFIIGTFLAAFSGILIAIDRNLYPTIGFTWLLYGVIAMILGGIGKFTNLIFGSLLLSVCQHLAPYYFDPVWMNPTAFIVLITFLVWNPYGFSGQKLRKAEL